MNAQTYDSIAARLVEDFGWTIDGCNAVKWTKNGQASFGLDGTVVVFYRRHADGHFLENMTLGAVQEYDGAAEAVNSMVERYSADCAQ